MSRYKRAHFISGLRLILGKTINFSIYFQSHVNVKDSEAKRMGIIFFLLEVIKHGFLKEDFEKGLFTFSFAPSGTARI